LKLIRDWEDVGDRKLHLVFVTELSPTVTEKQTGRSWDRPVWVS